MRTMMLVARRELAHYFNSYWAYAVVAAVLLLDGLLFNAYALGDQPKLSAKVLEDLLFVSFGTTVVAAILVSMRLIAEDRQTGTIVLLDSCPISPGQLIGGKYISALAVIAVATLASLYLPALIFVNGKVSYGHIAAGYLGLLLVGSTVVAIGTFASAVSKSQLVAGFVAAAVTVALIVMWWVARVTDPPFKDVVSYLSLFERHYRGFMVGTIKLEDVSFFVSLDFLFLMLASRFMAARRWR